MKIQIHDHQASVRLGCTAEERAYPQVVVFQIDLDVSDETSLESDALEDTVDYMQVLQVTDAVATEKEFHLLEHLLGSVGKELLSLSHSIKKVCLKATKQIAVTTSGISVEVKMKSRES